METCYNNIRSPGVIYDVFGKIVRNPIIDRLPLCRPAVMKLELWASFAFGLFKESRGKGGRWKMAQERLHTLVRLRVNARKGICA
jgi:hypothetical protein